MNNTKTELFDRISDFLGELQTLCYAQCEQAGISDKSYIISLDAGGKFLRVCKGSSAYCFIALEDNVTKTLGVVKAGDILKPASYKAPARVARGNVFEANCIECTGPYGISYLRDGHFNW